MWNKTIKRALYLSKSVLLQFSILKFKLKMENVTMYCVHCFLSLACIISAQCSGLWYPFLDQRKELKNFIPTMGNNIGNLVFNFSFHSFSHIFNLIKSKQGLLSTSTESKEQRLIKTALTLTLINWYRLYYLQAHLCAAICHMAQFARDSILFGFL